MNFEEVKQFVADELNIYLYETWYPEFKAMGYKIIAEDHNTGEATFFASMWPMNGEWQGYLFLKYYYGVKSQVAIALMWHWLDEVGRHAEAEAIWRCGHVT